MSSSFNACNGFCRGICVDDESIVLSRAKLNHEEHTKSHDLRVAELNGLSQEEREQVYEEVHGIADVVDETPELTSRSLHQMGEEISIIPKALKKAWERALFLRPSLATDEKLHLMFLRSERFDPKKAAAKLCRHFEHKMELFGDSKLVRRITLDDLDENAKARFYTGTIQFLVNSDRSGRGIYLMTGATFEASSDWKDMVRYCWYIVMSTLEENEEIQKRGVVQVFNLTGEWITPPSKVVATAQPSRHIVNDWPFRSCGFHLCYDNALLQSLITGISHFLVKELRIRERTHFGSPIEIQYSLMTFGMDLADAFEPGKGNMSREYIDRYLAERSAIEQEWKKQEQAFRDVNRDFVDYPISNDVLMGRGFATSWIGNQRLQSYVQSYSGRYTDDQSRIDKTMMQIKIVQHVQVEDGRFIEPTVNGWAVVPDQVAKQKVGQMLRSKRRKRDLTSAQSANK